eukprot:3599136-Prorocentrum_lima.AAC.1
MQAPRPSALVERLSLHERIGDLLVKALRKGLKRKLGRSTAKATVWQEIADQDLRAIRRVWNR